MSVPIPPVNFRSFKRRLTFYRKSFRKFINRTVNEPPAGINNLPGVIEKEVWKEVDCLSCANCCKTMTPTYTKTDIKRISGHFNLTPEAFIKKWLVKDRNKDYINKSLPCQFLDLKTNKCTIYAIRPLDCSGFPHLSKRKWKDYAHVHKQNIDFCPATFKLIEKMVQKMEGE